MQDSLGYRAGAPGNEETDESEVTAQTTVENEIAKWRAKEAKRIEKRLRGKLAREGQQPITGPAYQDRIQTSPPGELLTQAHHAAEYNKQVTQQTNYSEKDTEVSWRQARDILGLNDHGVSDAPRAAREVPRAARDVPRAVREQPEGYGARGPPVRTTRTTPVAVPPDKPPSPDAGETRLLRPVYTRMARRYLSIETLHHFSMDYTIDENPEYLLIKKFVPEPEQDMLWEHTRNIRERRRGTLGGVRIDTGAAAGRTTQYPSFEGANGEQFLVSQRSKKMAVEKPPRRVSRYARIHLPNSVEIGATIPTTTTSESSGSNQFSRFMGNTTDLSLALPGKSVGLRIESSLSSTISRDNVMGKEAREAELLAEFGKKQFSLRFCNLQTQGEDIAPPNQAQQDASSSEDEQRPYLPPLKSNEGEAFHTGEIRRIRKRANRSDLIENLRRRPAVTAGQSITRG